METAEQTGRFSSLVLCSPETGGKKACRYRSSSRRCEKARGGVIPESDYFLSALEREVGLGRRTGGAELI